MKQKQQPIGEEQDLQPMADQPDTLSEAQQTEEAQPPEQPEQPPEKTEAEQLTEQLTQTNDQLLRTMAEYDNFRKRSQKEKDAIYPLATANTVAQFIPIIDTFERALALECSDPEFKKGVEMILQNFLEVLGKIGVEAFGEPGDGFDPVWHNAVMHIEDESLEANVITDVFQKGYRLGERVIRHAMVKVAN